MLSFKPNPETEIEFTDRGRVHRIFIYARLSHSWILVKRPSKNDGDDFSSLYVEYQSLYACAQVALEKYLDSKNFERKPDRLDEVS